MKPLYVAWILLSPLFLFSLRGHEHESQRSLYRYAASQGLAGQVCCLHDLVFLEDGAVISGELEKVPPLLFEFGKLELNKEDIVFLTKEKKEGNTWRVAVDKGEKIVVAPLASSMLTVVEHRPQLNGFVEKTVREIPAEEIAQIIIKGAEQPLRNVAVQGALAAKQEAPKTSIHQPVAADKTSGFFLPLRHLADRGEKKEENTRPPATMEMPCYFSGCQQFTVPEIAFLEMPPALLAEMEELEAAECDLLAYVEEFDLDFSDKEEEPRNVDLPSSSDDLESIEFLTRGSLLPETLLSFNDEIEFEPDSGEFKGNNPDASQDPVLSPEGKDQEYIFISSGKGQPLPPALLTVEEEADGLIAECPPDVLAMKSAPASIPARQDTAAEEEMVFVPTNGQRQGFYIQRKKVTNADYKKFVEAVSYKAPSHWPGGNIPPHAENEPVVNVSYKDILLYAVWAGRRIPHVEELQALFSYPGLVADVNDQIDEWTSTLTVFEEFSGDESMEGYFPVKSLSSSGRVIFGKGETGGLRNNDYNSHTGFRLMLSR